MRTFTPPAAPNVDSTDAIQSLLNEGPGIVHVGPGEYRWGNVRVPAGVTLVGAGPATIIRATGDAIFDQSDSSHWALRDLTLEGSHAGPWRECNDENQSGVRIARSFAYDVTGITLRNFRGAGLQISHTKLGANTAPFSNGGYLDRITAHGNHIGVRFDQRAEYINATRFDCFQNTTGCVIHAGNVKIATSNFCSNLHGVHIEDKENGSHGCLSNCLINHNEKTALVARRARNGMVVDGCAFFYGAIELVDSRGVQITSGMINCHVTTSGEGCNRIAGNYVIPASYSFAFSPATIVENNFCESGAWKG